MAGNFLEKASSKKTFILYTLAIIIAELITTYHDVKTGLAFYGIILLFFIAHSSFLAANIKRIEHYRKNLPFLLIFLSILALMRLLSYAVPFVTVPTIYWYLIISVPIYAALLLAFRKQNILLEKVVVFLPGLREMPREIIIALTGLVFGVIEFFILRPAALIPALEAVNFIIAAVILLLATGFIEELLFRLAIQYNAIKNLGVMPGIAFTAFIFAVMHIGWKSILDLIFVFCVGIFYGLTFYKTRNILGITFSHGLTNVVLFLIMPFYFL